MKRKFFTYVLVFLITSFGALGIVTLLELFISDRREFSSLLSDLGNFGGFLSGIGTIIAAAAAAYGIDTWSKQIKIGKHLSHILDTKVLLSKFDNEFYFWCFFNTSEVFEEQSTKAFEAMNKVLKQLGDVSLQLDALSSGNQDEWVRKIRKLRELIEEHEKMAGQVKFNSDTPKVNINKALECANSSARINAYADSLRNELDKLLSVT
ncbi:hypothetical protein [Vibrio cholerae]|uniref:hypothetical protein n=1 Tax=Vibrio cholerae TaxID=666 RepID=UPI0011D5FD62|nr:hypothetical protein [Vibrio cholerae]TXX49931.1 hypothetical protein FXF14_06660 [Vibrio cholerae]